MRTRLALLLAGGALALAIAPTAAADRLVATSDTEVDHLSAYRGVLVWGGVNDGGGQSYLSSRGGRVRRLGVRADFLGDIDLGPARRHGTVAVYERCDSATSLDEPSECDIYRYGFSSHRSRRVRGASLRRFEETAPSTWRGRVVFDRSRLNRDEETVFAGPHLGLLATLPPTRLGNPKLSVPRTDLRGHTVAYLVIDRRQRSRILVKHFNRRGRGRSCQVARATDTVSLQEPELDGHYVHWLRVYGGDTAAGGFHVEVHRRRLPTDDCRPRGPEQLTRQAIPDSDDPQQTFAVDRGRLFYGTTTAPPLDTGPLRGDIWEMQPVDFINR